MAGKKLKFDPPWRASEVRDIYSGGAWTYAVGKPATTHKRYRQAVRVAEKRGFNPWWIRNCSDVCAVLDGCWMDEAAGRRVASFFNLLRHFEGPWAGQPFELMDWWKWDVIIPLFGWKRDNGTRRFRSGYIEAPKKNGKSSVCAGLIAYGLIGDFEMGAEIYSCAVDRTQSADMYRSVSQMLKSSPALSQRLTFVDSRYRIVHPDSASFYQALSSEAPNKEGKKVHMTVMDEIHVYPDRTLYDTLKYGGRSRAQPILIEITTAGIYDPGSIGWEEHEFTRRVIHGIGGAETVWRHFGYMLGLDKQEEELWDDPAMLTKANPSIGITLNEQELRDELLETKKKPAGQNRFKRYTYNIWTSSTETWISPAAWEKCGEDYTLDDLEGRPCWGGLDLSSTRDITAFVLYFPKHGDEKSCLWPWFWVPEENIRQFDEENNGIYSLWVEGGHLITTPGNVVDQEFIRRHIVEIYNRMDMRYVAFDRWGAEKLTTDLQNDGVILYSHGQGFVSMSNPTKTFERMVLRREILHPRNRVLDAHISNCEVLEDAAGNQKIVKTLKLGPSKSRKRFKVDGAIAAIMALNAYLSDESVTTDEASMPLMQSLLG